MGNFITTVGEMPLYGGGGALAGAVLVGGATQSLTGVGIGAGIGGAAGIGYVLYMAKLREDEGKAKDEKFWNDAKNTALKAGNDVVNTVKTVANDVGKTVANTQAGVGRFLDAGGPAKGVAAVDKAVTNAAPKVAAAATTGAKVVAGAATSAAIATSAGLQKLLPGLFKPPPAKPPAKKPIGLASIFKPIKIKFP